MAQNDDSESDIWEYKPLNKKKRQEPCPAAKRRCTVVKRDTSTARDTVKRDTVKRDTSTARDTVKRDTVKRDTSTSRDIVKRVISNPRDTVKRDTSTSRDTVKRDTSTSRDTIKRDTSNSRDTIKRDTSNSRDTVKRDTSNSRDTVKRDTSNSRDTVRRETSNPRDTVRRDTSNSSNSPVNVPSQYKEEPSKLWTQSLSSQTSQTKDLFASDPVEEERASPGDFCPICQMPFSILLVQSERWHVAECLDSPVMAKIKECPDGLRCSSNVPSHYKRYSHALLAHSRATDTVLPVPSQERETSLSCSAGPLTNDTASSISESSQNKDLSASSGSGTLRGETTPTKPKNALLLLRSPGPRDVKKRKGWSPTVKGLRSASQESKADVSSPSPKVDSGGQAFEGGFVKAELSPYNDDEISYSPLSEFPTEFEVNGDELGKAHESEDSPLLFSDAFSSDHELFDDFAEHCEAKTALMREHSSASSNTQVGSIISLVIGQPATSTAARNTPSSEKEEHGQVTNTISPSKPGLQSQQSKVLERLRETLSTSNNLHSKSLNENSILTEGTSTLRQVSSSQDSVTQAKPSPAMAPRKSQESQAGSLKQLDIGVFFGLKPLKEKGKEAEGESCERNTRPQGSLSGDSSGKRGAQRGGWQRKHRGGGGGDTETSTDRRTVEVSHATNAARGGRGRGGGGGGGGRRRWNRWGVDGESGEPKRCPFYKKIPGTKIAVDAFQYGEVEGISAYFLTHFHSDHYVGLKRTSKFHIYCNRITGNLVKTKLKVSEEYVHILPMNLPVTVEGVRVTLLEANHCPGAAMLLLLLADGQTVLHTGDFRADPSMETYPELLSCRVQTLYLDTTYCSPENSFPTQQEVINFAVNTAFELVTLNPRTLLVCGSYSVGKEKVFLALAEVLGSKVCLSKDKYNIMCCLESQRIKQLITTDLRAAQVHVLPMMQLNFKNLQAYLSRLSGQYEQLVAFKPTGWTFSPQLEALEDTRPRTCGNITIYGIPYSEHSSFLELKRFVQWLRPLKIIPTVNMGSLDSRKAMERWFSDWLQETKAFPKP